MPLQVVTTGYGAPASVALRDELARLKGDEPLAPVTVIVPTNSVGVSVRRTLASGSLGPVAAGRPGLVGVNFLTVYRLAELLAAPLLAGTARRPVSTPVVAAAVRRVLAEQPGLFAPVAEHPATEEALVDAHRELSDLDAAALRRLAATSPRANDVVRVHRAARRLLADSWYDEHDLMRVARDVLRDGGAHVDELGHVVCFLPQRWSTPEAAVVATLAERNDVQIIAGLTGVPAADAPVVASVERAGGKITPDAIDGIAPAIGSAIVTYSDPDDEVRGVVRGVLDAMRSGIPAERIAVLYASDEPYARLLHEHLDLAGIVHNGASVRTLAESVLGRALLQLLSLGDERFRRDQLFAFLASAPVLDGRRRVPAADWERLSRDAGVVGGLDEWDDRLARYCDDLDDTRDWDVRERARADALRAFVAELGSDLDRGRRARSWSELCTWTNGVIRRWLGDERRREHDGWPPFEQEAARRVDQALDRLSGLDAVDDAPSFDVFRRTLELELRSANERLGRLGAGVLVGGVGLSLGVEVDALFVCGLAEGVFPSVARDDPLLSDSERGVLDGELRLRRERVHDLHRGLLAAFASTTGARRCSVPRGDLRRTTEHVMSRFLTATREDADVGEPTVVASFVQGLARAPFPATEHELAVRAATVDDVWARRLRPVQLGLALSRARASAEFTRFDGNLATLADRLGRWNPTTEGVVVSASRLQAWAACPHAFLFRYILHVEPIARPEEIEQLSPLDRGSLMHRALERFIDEVGSHEAAGRPWTDADRERLRAITQEECDDVEAHGLVGRRLLWQRDRRLILAELDAFLSADQVFRDLTDAQTLATELSFGGRDGDYDAVPIMLSDGRSLRVQGAIDRVDRLGDGSLFVIDYKTGSEQNYVALEGGDPVLGGGCLQLPIYAAAAQEIFESAGAPVDAAYWFVGRGKNRRIGYVVDEAVRGRFDEVIRLIVAGIEAGCFIASPPTPGPKFFVECEYCDPDHRGTGERWRETERKRTAVGLDAFRALVRGDDDAETEEA